jgi:histidinol-phosphate phosphatase family protein
MEISKPAVFLDRDGVLNADRVDFVKSVEELVILPGALESVVRLNRAGFSIVVVSNQSCIGQGLLSWDGLQAITDALQRAIVQTGGQVLQFYYCPHTAKHRCDCRKPQPGMLLRAAQDWNLDLSRSFMVGDTQRDIVAGKSVGCRAALVLSGATTSDMINVFDLLPDYIADDLAAATQWILDGLKDPS